ARGGAGGGRAAGPGASPGETGRCELPRPDKKPGAAIATHRVVVFPGRGGTGGDREAPLVQASARGLPQAYTIAAQTPLRVEVTPEQHTYDLNLTRSAQPTRQPPSTHVCSLPPRLRPAHPSPAPLLSVEHRPAAGRASLHAGRKEEGGEPPRGPRDVLASRVRPCCLCASDKDAVAMKTSARTARRLRSLLAGLAAPGLLALAGAGAPEERADVVPAPPPPAAAAPAVVPAHDLAGHRSPALERHPPPP